MKELELKVENHKDTIDFRPVFNQVVYESSYGSTGVEFKIGSRPHAHEMFSLLSSSGSIESNREFTIMDLDTFVR